MCGCIFVFTICRFIQVTEKAVLKAGRAPKCAPLTNSVLLLLRLLSLLKNSNERLARPGPKESILDSTALILSYGLLPLFLISCLVCVACRGIHYVKKRAIVADVNNALRNSYSLNVRRYLTTSSS